MTPGESSNPETAQGIEQMLPDFENAQEIREYYGLRDDITLQSEKDEVELLDRMRERHPDFNGRLNEAHEYVSSLYRQHLTRNALQEDVKSEVSEAQVEKQKSWFRRHPWLTAGAGVAALLALLYFTGPLATTAGEYGGALIESFKTVLAKIGIGTPAVLTEAAGDVAVGTEVGAEAAELAAEAFQSAGSAASQTMEAIQSAAQATGASAQSATLSAEAAGKIMSSPQVLEGMEQVVDPLQRILQQLPPK
ncbi:hypothetical protein FJZ28_00590 [Candidatus Peregrinibacteria bacterium]|nr:hypothetical protein [Candidatus Peregrinibacteria bacterium]